MEQLINITLIVNLAFSLLNVVLYGIGYKRINYAKVDGKLRFTKRVLLFEFITVTIFALLQAVIYITVVFYNKYTTEALYLENFAILFFNVAFAINAILLAIIVEKK